MRTKFFNTMVFAALAVALNLAVTEVAAQSATRRGNSSNSTTTPSSSKITTPNGSTISSTSKRANGADVNRGRNYNDHVSNVVTGSKDRPSKPAVPNNIGGDKNEKKDVNVRNKNDRKDACRGNSSDRYVGARGNTNPPVRAPKYEAPRYNRADPNRHLGYSPFKDGRIIHRPKLYNPRFDFGVRFSSRPRNAFRVSFSGLSLFFADGIWYNYKGGHYTIYRPPVGVIVSYNSISPNLYYLDFEVVADYGEVYYVDSYANFYRPVRNFRTYGNRVDLMVVNAPIGAILYDLPSDYREIIINGRLYYLVGNSVFDYVYTSTNSWYFRCIGQYR